MIRQREPLRRARDLPPVRIHHPFVDRRTLGPRSLRAEWRRSAVAGRRPSVAVGCIFSEILVARVSHSSCTVRTTRKDYYYYYYYCYNIVVSPVRRRVGWRASAEKQTSFPRKPSSVARTALRIVSLSLAAVGNRALSSSYDRPDMQWSHNTIIIITTRQL